ncbi:hypothetical protein ES703_112716 [subsurface metagenome]
MEYYKFFKITGVAGTTTTDAGLTSSAEAPKRLKSVMVHMSAHSGNKVQGWLEREKVFDLPDHLIDTQQVASENRSPMSLNKLNEIPVGVDMPVGTTFAAAIECVAAADLYGAYRYEIIG